MLGIFTLFHLHWGKIIPNIVLHLAIATTMQVFEGHSRVSIEFHALFFRNFARLKNWWPIMEKGGGPGGSGKAMSVRLLQGMLGASLVMNAFLLLALTHSSSHEAAQTRNR